MNFHFSLLSSSFIFHLAYKERRNYKRKYEGREEEHALHQKRTEMLYANENFVVVIQTFSTSFS